MADFSLSLDDVSYGTIKYSKFGSYGNILVRNLNISTAFTGIGDTISATSVALRPTVEEATVNIPLLFYITPAYDDSDGNKISGQIHSCVSGLFERLTSSTTGVGDLAVYYHGTKTITTYFRPLITVDNISIGVYSNPLDGSDGTISILFKNGSGAEYDTLYDISSQSVSELISQYTFTTDNIGYIPVVCGYYSTVLNSYLCFSYPYVQNLFGYIGSNSGTISQAGIIKAPSEGSFGSFSLGGLISTPLPPISSYATLINVTSSVEQLFDKSNLSDTDDSGDSDDNIPDQNKPGQNSPNPSSHYGGGQGDFDYTSDTVSDVEPPTVKYNSVGVAGVWTPSSSQLSSIMKAIWSSSFLKPLKELFQNNSPLDAVISLRQMPFSVSSSGTATMALGTVSTDVTVDVAGEQFVTLTYTGTVKSFTGDFNDYEPYTDISIHLPFVGIVSLDTNTVMGKTITVKYIIDITTGATLCAIQVSGNTLYTYETSCGYEIPVTAMDTRNQSRNIASFALSTALSVASMGTMTSGQAMMTAGGIAGQGAMAGGTQLRRSGGIGGTAGSFDSYDVYLIYKCPNVGYDSKNNPGIHGYKGSGVVKLSNLKGTGYAEIQWINPGISGASQREIDEIDQMLRNGVIL